MKISLLSKRMKNKEERHKGRWWTFVNLVLTNTDAIRSSLCFRRDRFCFAILGAIEKPVSCRNNKLAFEYNKPCLHWDPPNPKHLKQLAKQEHTKENIKPVKIIQAKYFVGKKIIAFLWMKVTFWRHLVVFLDAIEYLTLTHATYKLKI